jgi:hypothetical protein
MLDIDRDTRKGFQKHLFDLFKIPNPVLTIRLDEHFYLDLKQCFKNTIPTFNPERDVETFA